MNKLRLYDTETTKLNGEVVEVAYVDIYDDDEVVAVLGDTCGRLVKPKQPISYGAMAVHNITNKMVEKAPYWADIQHHFIPPEDYYVGSYNWEFDSKMLGNGFNNNKSICVLELARKLIPKTECDSHTNMAIFYYLGLDEDYWPEGEAHRAAFDVKCSAMILITLMERFNLTLDGVYDLLNQPKLFTCPFTKHRGKLWAEVLKEDSGYVEWIVGNNKLQNKDEHDKLYKLLNGGEE